MPRRQEHPWAEVALSGLPCGCEGLWTGTSEEKTTGISGSSNDVAEMHGQLARHSGHP